MTKRRIEDAEAHTDGNTYVAFSGGLDSTVLLSIVRQVAPGTPAVHVSTGLEYPELEAFVKTKGDVTILRPSKTFRQVLKDYGYPVVSKKVARFIQDVQSPTENNEATRRLRLTGINQKGERCPSMKLPEKWRYLVDAPFKVSDKCCLVMKEAPLSQYAKETQRIPYIGILAEESQRREKEYMQTGCNAFDNKNPKSMPLAFWTHQDILRYILENNLEYPSVYGDIVEVDGKLQTTREKRTGCMFCAFGAHLEATPNRFQRMASSHPKLYRYCMEDLDMKTVLDYVGVPYWPESRLFDVG